MPVFTIEFADPMSFCVLEGSLPVFRLKFHSREAKYLIHFKPLG